MNFKSPFKAPILMTEFVTHDVKRFVLAKPKGLKFVPGQGALLAIDKPGLRDEGHPFTPISPPAGPVIEFTIKGYPRRRGLTERLHQLVPGDGLLIKAVFGDIRYKGPGVFIAAGTGITPMVAILRQLRTAGKLAGNTLILSNKTWADIILERELRAALGDRCIFTLTREKRAGYEHRRIDERFLRVRIRDFSRRFYVCGPGQFTEEINAILLNLGARRERLVFDE
jgi:cytochrome-b5 reductase